MVRAAMNVGVWDVVSELQELIAEQAPVDRDALQDGPQDDEPGALAQLRLRRRAHRSH